MTLRIVILAGEPEYDSHQTLAPIATLLSEKLDAHVDLLIPDIIDDEPDFPESSFDNIDAIDNADLLIVYTRFRVLPDDQMRSIQKYLDSKRPVIGLRTSTHAFHFPDSSAWASWNAGFGRDILGSPWISHHGHSSRTRVTVDDSAPSELIHGLPDAFTVRSWLYVTDPQPWCRPILEGSPINPETDSHPGLVAWYGKPDNRKTFYTSLGHPDDLLETPVQTLLLNAASWAVSTA
ncbi:hypothetical protein GCM10025867_02220 [Frondihabitans sucicola]|uniref:ThuA-like domain-containing protein n=1 Tax=Frondihabitans sucicola TaxID=1268041 RepID=A0ABN6XSK2_9MICO|nr:ThuA domain-containing protein [Frondihabitans sucicola]BDZ47981.1 hypothetical protein GCM10025867_02220 [Frondihabitans sucicola]